MNRKRDGKKERTVIFQSTGPASSKDWKGREIEKKSKLWKVVRKIK